MQKYIKVENIICNFKFLTSTNIKYVHITKLFLEIYGILMIFGYFIDK